MPFARKTSRVRSSLIKVPLNGPYGPSRQRFMRVEFLTSRVAERTVWECSSPSPYEGAYLGLNAPFRNNMLSDLHSRINRCRLLVSYINLILLTTSYVFNIYSPRS